MESIRVELSQIVNERREGQWELTATIGDRNVAERLLTQPMVTFRGYLPSALRNYARIGQQRRYTLSDYLNPSSYTFNIRNNPLPPSVLADAIRAYLTEIAPELQGESHVSAIESDMDVAENLAASQPPLLSIGGRLFRLNPVAETGGPIKLLDRMRSQAAQAIATQREALVASANTEAKIIRQQAERGRALLAHERRLWEQEKAREGVMTIPPWIVDQGGVLWVQSGEPSRLGIELTLRYQPEKFVFPDWEVRPEDGAVTRINIEWSAREAPPLIVPFWLRFNPTDGSYAVDDARVSEPPFLPHADRDTFCVQPQGLPERIEGWGDCQAVVQAINRAFKVVNLSSLLVHEDDWSPQVMASVPQGVNDFLERWREEGQGFDPVAECGARITPPEPPSQIWEAPAGPRLRRAGADGTVWTREE
jgi:hypothetical protein